MGIAQANGLELAYEIEGSGPPLLMIMGLGGQLTDWHPAMIQQLAEHFTVIRFDNRDSGLSTYSQARAPSRLELVKASLFPPLARPAYTLDDMADDAAGLLDALGIDQAHVVGMSMGGMIAQLLTLRHPSKVLSLCSIMSHPGDRMSGRPSPKVLLSLARRGQPKREDFVATTLDLFRLVGGPDWSESEHRRRSSISLARSYNPAGALRQTVAIAVAKNRTRRLASVTQPTLVMHGLDDQLIRPSGGKATARALPHCRLILFPRMGHDLPATRHADMTAAIRKNVALAS